MSFTVEIAGVAEAINQLRRFAEDADQATGAALRQEGEIILAWSQQQVPVDTGVLKASGAVLGPIMSYNGVEVQVGYGGAAKAYARRQHEETGWRHRVGKAKYLEDPFMARVQSGLTLQAIQREIFRRVRGV